MREIGKNRKIFVFRRDFRRSKEVRQESAQRLQFPHPQLQQPQELRNGIMPQASILLHNLQEDFLVKHHHHLYPHPHCRDQNQFQKRDGPSGS